jgi:hypothetical protein
MDYGGNLAAPYPEAITGVYAHLLIVNGGRDFLKEVHGYGHKFVGETEL